MAQAFDEAGAGHRDPASRLIWALTGLLWAVEGYMPGEQPDASAELVAAIERAAPLMAKHSAAAAILNEAGVRAAVSLAITFSQSFAEVRALAAAGLMGEWQDVVGLIKVQLELTWRVDRLARRFAARSGSAAVDASGPVPGTSRH